MNNDSNNDNDHDSNDPDDKPVNQRQRNALAMYLLGYHEALNHVERGADLQTLKEHAEALALYASGQIGSDGEGKGN